MPPTTTIGYHTCRDSGNAATIKRDAPYESISTDLFLSRGFYFWEEDEESAHWWGESHYHSKYAIVKCELYIENLLDLVGNILHRRSLPAFEALVQKEYPGVPQNLTIGEIITYLKDLRQTHPEVFPFDAVRADEQKAAFHNKQYKKFSRRLPAQMLINSQYIICVFRSTPQSLPNRSLIYPPQYI